MSYKVTFQTLSLMNDGKIGNVAQSREIIYTDIEIPKIPAAINKSLEKRKKVCEILTIESIPGSCLSNGSNLHPVFEDILKQHGIS